ncbi:MAG: 3-isopropylmalate dehydrogenase [Dehalococcoidia bacterium]|nr:3-isopropylmalate dehydrogenase [Dehalococcoidia bacterium]
MQSDIAVLPGDGIGPEVTHEATKVLGKVADIFGHKFDFHEGLIGGISIDTTGVALTEETFEMARGCAAILFGATGGPKWDDIGGTMPSNRGLFRIRKELQLFANPRHIKMLPALVNCTPFKSETVEGVDLIILRELIGGLYFAEPRKQWSTAEGRQAVDTMFYTEAEIARVVRVGFELARGRRKRLMSVDKSNVLQTSSLWRKVATEVGKEYPDVELSHMYVDACTMELIRNPRELDVLVMDNTFGDILSDEGSMLCGSLGMAPSASLSGSPGGKVFGLYEPIHGTAPTIAGQDIANPLASILSAALLLRYSLELFDEALAVEAAVNAVLEEGYRTADIAEKGRQLIGTKEMGQRVADALTSSRN